MSTNTSGGEMVRTIDWKGAFWIASGVPSLVLFSIGQARVSFSPVVIRGSDQVIGLKKETLVGATFGTDRSVASPTYLNTVGVWAEVTPRVAGVFTLLSVRLHFRVNGGPEQTTDGINDILTVCAADPAPSPGDCEPAPSGGG